MNPVNRKLRTEEQALLDFLLSAQFPGVDELSAQAAHAFVSGECECGCGTIELQLDSNCPPARLQNRIPIEAYAETTEVLLFTKEGLLSCLEIVDYLVSPARSFPRPEKLQLWIKPPMKETTPPTG